MNRFKTLLLLVIFSSIITGCETVSSLQPAGLTAIKTPVEQWQGSWLVNDDGVLHTKVLDPDKGELLLIIVNVEREYQSELLETHNVTVRRTDNHYYFNLVDINDNKKEYYFAKFTREGNTIKVAMPSFDFIANAVNSGKLAGSVNKDAYAIILKADAAQFNDFLESHPDAFENKLSVLKKIGE